jgi:hypothetical protein
MRESAAKKNIEQARVAPTTAKQEGKTSLQGAQDTLRASDLTSRKNFIAQLKYKTYRQIT